MRKPVIRIFQPLASCGFLDVRSLIRWTILDDTLWTLDFNPGSQLPTPAVLPPFDIPRIIMDTSCSCEEDDAGERHGLNPPKKDKHENKVRPHQDFLVRFQSDHCSYENSPPLLGPECCGRGPVSEPVSRKALLIHAQRKR